MFTIALIGTGAIGSRYLQGMIKIRKKVDILAVEPLKSSSQNAINLWNEVGGKKSKHNIQYVNNLNGIKKKFDLVIIATSSQDRPNLIKEVRQKLKPNYWIIEKILAQSETGLKMIKKYTYNSSGVWVNKPRRLMHWHKKLKTKFNGKGPLSIEKIGGLWGLTCNSIHFIDLVCWWTGESLLSLNSNELDKKWFKSKRANYYEITGKLKARFSGGTKLTLISNKNKKSNLLKVKTLDNKLWIIDEQRSEAYSSEGIFLNGKLENQSDFTGNLLNKIIAKKKCDLPTLKESYKQHKIFLKELIKHWNSSQNSQDKEIPIT
ncbi:MAG: hypothetical protein CMF96_08370 [Candidatus Marinimicrobia bacterium]|nr:hypothetical protein [Candidatus Neomarinimicrobiota bacterium]|tara:strand:+ start:225 stop:1181 length:957 start_codon:yes stop_codon:yes gene_type:complete